MNALHIIMPPVLLEAAMNALEQVHVPRKDELSRGRFLMDSAYMQWTRARNSVPRPSVCRYELPLSWLYESPVGNLMGVVVDILPGTIF